MAAVFFAGANALLFGIPLYRAVLDPSSSTGSFEAAVAALDDAASDARTDVLVMGDSRIYAGLDPTAAHRGSGQTLRFINAGVPGTTPRCWYYFLQRVDPSATRYRALVVPVDTYGDNDSAIGSIDGDQRRQDLHYLALSLAPWEIPRLADSFPGLRTKLTTGADLLLRGPLLRDDIQAFILNPRARFRAIEAARAGQPYSPLARHPRTGTLQGLAVDFVRDTIRYPASVPPDERAAMPDQVLRIAHADPVYAAYRREWLYPIVQRYVDAGTPVIFVRIPTRPAHRHSGDPLGGSLALLARNGAARFLAAQPYIALEQPGLFADHDHLNQRGSVLFSQQLGHDVALALASAAPTSVTGPTIPQAVGPQHQPWLREAVGIGIPLQFQSYEFWIFVAVVALLFYASPLSWRRFLLLGVSYYFYARWNGWYVVFLLAITVSDFLIALALERVFGNRRRALLAAGIAANVAFLGTFKYANFTTGTVTALLGMHQDPWFVSWIVPIGISFHTFQSISYLVDVHRSKTPAIRDPWDYALYLAFFPQLLSGPIVRAGLFFGELFHWKPPSADDVNDAGVRIAFGLFKKVAIADHFAPAADAYFGSLAGHPGALAAWTAIFAFSMQIYFDFSAYSDIAIGTARLFGFVFPENFNLPYLAGSVTEFWHRWHMTLSTWLRDYIYIPLGGNRDGRFATLRNLMVTMLLGGLWHGAQWTFVVWGGLHGLYLVFERITGIAHRPIPDRPLSRAPRVLATFLLVTLAWVLFRAQTFPQALAAYRELVATHASASMLTDWGALLSLAIIIFAAARIALGQNTRLFMWKRLSPLAQAACIASLLLGVELLSSPGAPTTFIYFKF